MCELALVGARADGFRLLEVLSGTQDELDVQLLHDARAPSCFPETDSVARVTLNGCSCSLLEGLGRCGRTRREARVSEPSDVFRRVIAGAVMAFGGARLLITNSSSPVTEHAELATLSQFLRGSVAPRPGLITIVP